jgi:ferredoxin
LTDDGYSVADTDDVPADSEAVVREAIECCPEEAIAES